MPLFGGDVAIGLVNWSDVWNLSENIDLNSLGFDGKVRIRDLWAHQDIGVFEKSFSSGSIPPHGIKVFRISVV